MEDTIRDLVVQTWGPLYVIGSIVTVGAFIGAFAWKLKEGSRGLAIFLACCAAALAIFAIAAVPKAKAICKNAYMAESSTQISLKIGPYYEHHCQNIMTCIGGGGYLPATCY